MASPEESAEGSKITPEMQAFAEQLARSMMAEMMGGRRRGQEPAEPTPDELERQRLQAEMEAHGAHAGSFATRIALQRELTHHEANMVDARRDERIRPAESRFDHVKRLQDVARQVAEAAQDKDVSPDYTIGHREVIRQTHTRYSPFKSIQRPLKTVGEQYTDLAEGWVLARTQSIVNKRSQVQEIMLGTNGKLYSYTRGDVVTRDLLNGPASRSEIVHRSSKHNMHSAGGFVQPSLGGDGKPDFKAFGASNFDTVMDTSRPDYMKQFAVSPELIEQGLAELVIEQNLQLPPDQPSAAPGA